MTNRIAWVIDKQQETLSEVLGARKPDVKGPAFAKSWFAYAEHGRGNHQARVRSHAKGSVLSPYNCMATFLPLCLIFSTTSKEGQHVTLGSEFPARELSEDKVKLECICSKAS